MLPLCFAASTEDTKGDIDFRISRSTSHYFDVNIALQADSGGPLFYNDPHPIQIGVMVFGDHRCGENISAPDAYMSVGEFRQWIDQTVATV